MLNIDYRTIEDLGQGLLLKLLAALLLTLLAAKKSYFQAQATMTNLQISEYMGMQNIIKPWEVLNPQSIKNEI